MEEEHHSRSEVKEETNVEDANCLENDAQKTHVAIARIFFSCQRLHLYARSVMLLLSHQLLVDKIVFHVSVEGNTQFLAYCTFYWIIIEHPCEHAIETCYASQGSVAYNDQSVAFHGVQEDDANYLENHCN